jgi:hypothetical protein
VELGSIAEDQFSDPHYDPPRVHWLALAAVITAFSVVASLSGVDYSNGFLCLLYVAWAFYFCIWLRRIEPTSKSLFWLVGSIAVGAISLILTTIAHFNHLLLETADWLGTLAIVLYLACIFVIRSELVRHYNRRENYTLVLGPIMTFFFSFCYFQFHLYDIAMQRRKEREALAVL